MSSDTMRSSSDMTIAFKLPTGYGADVAKNDFVAVQLPYQWMGVSSWMDGSATATASMKKVTTTTTGTTTSTSKKEMKGSVVQVSGCNVVFQLDTTTDATNVLAEAGSYEFVLSGVPTVESKAGADSMMLGSVVLSVGIYSKGSYGWSSAPMFNALKKGTVATGLNLLEFKDLNVAVSRGTYTKNAVCI
jgi:hypothetical protein